MSGLSPDRIALLNWMLAGTVAGVAGILIAPLSPLTPSTYTLFVVPALAAAIVGEFKYLVPTALAGIGIGMIQAWLVFLSGKYSWMPQSGVGEIVPLVVMLVALLVTGKAVPERGSVQRPPLGRAPRPRSYTLPIVAGFVVGAVALVVTHGTARASLINTLIFAVVVLSLVVVTGYAGQVSLAQLALAGVGGFMLSYLTVDWGVPFPIAPLLAALATTVVGVLVGLPALRLRGLTLGVVTLALAYGIEAIWFRNSDLVESFGNAVESPTVFGIDFGIGVGKEFPRLEFGFLCLVVLVVVAFAVARLRNSAFGSAMLAVRANERSAAGIGVNVVFVKVVSFAIVSFVAGLAGCLLAYRQGVITWESFAALAGLAFLTTVYLAGVTSVFGGVNAGIIAAGGIVFYCDQRVVRAQRRLVRDHQRRAGHPHAHAQPRGDRGRWPRARAQGPGVARPAPGRHAGRCADVPRRGPVDAVGDDPRRHPDAAGARRARGAPGRRPVGPLRRGHRRRHRCAPRPAGWDRRAHRSQRSRQDERDRRDHRLREVHGLGHARRRTHRRPQAAPTRAPWPRPHLPGASSSTTTSPSRRT